MPPFCPRKSASVLITSVFAQLGGRVDHGFTQQFFEPKTGWRITACRCVFFFAGQHNCSLWCTHTGHKGILHQKTELYVGHSMKTSFILKVSICLHQSGPCKPVPHSLALWHSKVFPGSWRETGGPCPHWNWLVEKIGSVFLPSLRLLPDSLPVWVALPYFTDTPKYAPPPVCLFRSAGTTCSWLAKWGILWIFLVYFKKCLAVCQNNMSPTEIPCHPDWRPLWPPRTLQAVFHGEPHVAQKRWPMGPSST